MSRIFYVGDPDVFSLLDLGLKNAHMKNFDEHLYNETFYQEFSPYRSYLCLYMCAFMSMCVRVYMCTYMYVYI